jgi:hypothetical protein
MMSGGSVLEHQVRLQRATTIFLLALVCGGCASSDQGHAPQDPALKRVAARFGADYVGENSIVVYARDPDGKPLTECGSNFCRDEHGIRITAASNPSQPLKVHGTPIREEPRFTFYSANDGAVSRRGFMEYRPNTGDVVWIQPILGPPTNTMQAEFNIDQRYSVRYDYQAATEKEHARIYGAVSNYLHRVGLR